MNKIDTLFKQLEDTLRTAGKFFHPIAHDIEVAEAKVAELKQAVMKLRVREYTGDSLLEDLIGKSVYECGDRIQKLTDEELKAFEKESVDMSIAYGNMQWMANRERDNRFLINRLVKQVKNQKI